LHKTPTADTVVTLQFELVFRLVNELERELLFTLEFELVFKLVLELKVTTDTLLCAGKSEDGRSA
jgi:hypothetical protein